MNAFSCETREQTWFQRLRNRKVNSLFKCKPLMIWILYLTCITCALLQFGSCCNANRNYLDSFNVAAGFWIEDSDLKVVALKPPMLSCSFFFYFYFYPSVFIWLTFHPVKQNQAENFAITWKETTAKAWWPCWPGIKGNHKKKKKSRRFSWCTIHHISDCTIGNLCKPVTNYFNCVAQWASKHPSD